MSKQIRFVQDEADTIEFLAFLDSLPICINLSSGILRPSLAETLILDCMNTYSCQLLLVPAQRSGEVYVNNYKDVISGNAIECSNSVKGNPLSRTYECGRIYIHKNGCGTYDSLLLSLYTQICLYIKRNYIYGSKTGIYWGKNILEKSRAQQCNVMQQGKTVTFS